VNDDKTHYDSFFSWPSGIGLSFSVSFSHLDYFLSVAELANWRLNSNENNSNDQQQTHGNKADVTSAARSSYKKESNALPVPLSKVFYLLSLHVCKRTF